jgi:hypothetical protein
MTFDQWFINQQGLPYDSSYLFAKAAWDYQQADIDRLMLEFCPNEMTEEQVRVWQEAQIPFKEPL